jgi:hypothetical protein
MIDERQYIKDAIYDWVEAVVQAAGRTDEVIWRDDNGPRPVSPFISIEIVGGSRRGRPWKSPVRPATQVPPGVDEQGFEYPPEDMGVQTIMQPAKKTLTMYGFGEGSFDLLETIRDTVYLDDYRNLLGQKGLAVTHTFDVTGVGFEIAGVREMQPHFDFVVAFNRVITDKPGWIEHVHIEAENLPMKPIEN